MKILFWASAQKPDGQIRRDIVMKKIKNLIIKTKQFINCLYYLRSSIAKNTYPCKLVGEKINPLGNGTIILYKIRGEQDNNEIPLQYLLNTKKLIEKFHPTDAVKLGSIALKDILLELNENERNQKFNIIKNIMLNSTHDIYPIKEFKILDYQHKTPTFNNSVNKDDYLDSAVMGNTYPCKLVGSKATDNTSLTIIIFTILGKREGYEKSLSELLKDKKLIERFHPTEAIKFGFIALGDSIFELPIGNRKQPDN